MIRLVARIAGDCVLAVDVLLVGRHAGCADDCGRVGVLAVAVITRNPSRNSMPGIASPAIGHLRQRGEPDAHEHVFSYRSWPFSRPYLVGHCSHTRGPHHVRIIFAEQDPSRTRVFLHMFGMEGKP